METGLGISQQVMGTHGQLLSRGIARPDASTGDMIQEMTHSKTMMESQRSHEPSEFGKEEKGKNQRCLPNFLPR